LAQAIKGYLDRHKTPFDIFFYPDINRRNDIFIESRKTMIHFGVSEKKVQELHQRMQACDIREEDLEESFVHSQGPGGQHVNKNATCVVLLHKPTALKVKIQKSRSQMLNRYYARKRLCELLEAQTPGRKSPEAKRIAKLKKQKDRRRRRHKKT
jgi:protein subunit release factor B